MRNALVLGAALFAAGVAAPPALAQALELPQPSPGARVMQKVGLTELTVDYSSPAVKGRKVWGELVPLDKPWRTGANAATKITFSRDVTFGGQKVAAGTYAIVTLPTAEGWTVVLSKDLALWGAGKTYDAKDDVVRVPGATAEIPHRERLLFLFSDTTDDATRLDLEWEKVRVSVAIGVDTKAQAKDNIAKALDAAWRPHAAAGRYLAETDKDYDGALRLLDASLSIKSTWYNNWLKADVLAKKGRTKDALKFAQVAWDLGQKDLPGFFYKDQVEKALKEWKAKK